MPPQRPKNPALAGCNAFICFQSRFVWKFMLQTAYPTSWFAYGSVFPEQPVNPMDIKGVLHPGMCCVHARTKSPVSVLVGFSARCWSHPIYALYTQRFDVRVSGAVFFTALQDFYCGITDIEAGELLWCKSNSAGKSLALRLFWQ